MWFNAETTVGGVEAISNYHEKQDEKRGIGLGPNHDWSSHGADAFGLMCIHYEAPQEKRKARNRESGGGSWMG
jgi:phage terminase large subunit